MKWQVNSRQCLLSPYSTSLADLTTSWIRRNGYSHLSICTEKTGLLHYVYHAPLQRLQNAAARLQQFAVEFFGKILKK